ncbi:site-specific integrase [Agrobacterium larrymoorei]|uniref:Site-specific integrase n=1 Tax=Agrobacterium larrymoorei TaxID=160699 RepID=A0AAF0KE31_9HYPH|nr:site-specific integrase [Agrobacterium larrymoorei]WHA41653.1 site-specific integrase [Agrobacterium larrymoorei]
MPRKSKGPRLYLRSRKGRPPIWVVLDTGYQEISTGCSREDRDGAEKFFSVYLSKKHRPDWRTGVPREVSVADVLNYYGQEKAVRHAHPELVGYHMTPLLKFFGSRMCDFIDASSCRAYTAARVAGMVGARKVQATTARRELETLQAALRFCRREKKLGVDIDVTLPPKAEARQRWLTRSEAAALIGGVLGFTATAFDVESRQPVKWGRLFKPSYHVARFILIGLYTATRHEAILAMHWKPNMQGGWFDIANGIMYRRGQGQKETHKRRPTVPLQTTSCPILCGGVN